MSDAASIRKATTLPAATGVNASAIRYSNFGLWFSNGTTFQNLVATSDTRTTWNGTLVTTTGQSVFVADRKYKITSIKYSHAVKSNTAGLTVAITRELGSAAVGSGNAVATFTAGTTANIVQTGTIAAAEAFLNAGERLAIKQSATVNGLSGITVTVTLMPVGDPAILVTSTGAPVTAASASLFIADRAYKLIAASIKAGVAGGADCTGTLVKDTGTAAPGAGTALMSAALPLNVTTEAFGALATTAVVVLAPGDRISFTTAGTVGSLASITTKLWLLPV